MFVFDPDIHIEDIALVGAGGTGAEIARSIARLLYHMQQANMRTPDLTIIDPDTVELKNVGRQLFTAADVGHNKAEVLMRRFNMALGLKIGAIPHPVSKSHLDKKQVVIGAVDNHEARRILASVPNRTIWIDAGNHQNSGQVIIGNINERNLMRKYIDEEKQKDIYRYLPDPHLIFPSLLEPESAPDTTHLSCAELVAMQEQDLFVNDWMALATAQYVYKLLMRQPIHHFMTYVSADGIGVRSVPIGPDELRAALQTN